MEKLGDKLWHSLPVPATGVNVWLRSHVFIKLQCPVSDITYRIRDSIDLAIRYCNGAGVPPEELSAGVRNWVSVPGRGTLPMGE